MLDYVYYCHNEGKFLEEQDILNEGGYSVCPSCSYDSLQRFKRDEIPKELEAEHGFGETKTGP